MAFIRHSVLKRAQQADGLRRQEIKTGRAVAMQGLGRVVVVLDESCPDDISVLNNLSGASFGTGARVTTIRPGGGLSRAVIGRPPAGSGTLRAPRQVRKGLSSLRRLLSQRLLIASCLNL